MRKFKGNSLNTLVTTDVAARSMNLPDVDLVIQYDPPRDKEMYI